MAAKQNSWIKRAALAMAAAAFAACLASVAASCGAEDLQVGGENPIAGPTNTPSDG